MRISLDVDCFELVTTVICPKGDAKGILAVIKVTNFLGYADKIFGKIQGTAVPIVGIVVKGRVVEGVSSNVGKVFANRDRTQSGTVTKRAVAVGGADHIDLSLLSAADIVQRGGKLDRGQLGTTRKGTRTNALQTLREGDALQIQATAERSTSNFGHVVGNDQRRQRFASFKSIVSDALYALGNRDLCK